MTATTILPSNRTPFEVAVEGVSAARLPLPTHLVSSVWDPATCPADLLPYLAWGLSVDLWDDAWAETTKREACRKALLLHRLKTTPAGIKAHVEQAGATVLKVTRPPARESLRGAMTDEQRRAWLDALPQVRIYPFFIRAIAKSRHFHKGPGVTHQWHGQGFLRASRGFAVYGRRATLYDRGVETEITLGTTDAGITERVLIRRHAPRRVFHGHAFLAGYLRASVAETNVITIQLSDAHQNFAVAPSMEPVNVRPQRIAQGRVVPDSRAFFGRHGRFLRTSHAPLMIYDRIALNDPTRAVARRKVKAFHGHGRFGIDPFTAELKIRVPMVRRRLRSGRWHGSGYRRAADMAPLVRAIEAVRVSKAFRDTVFINTATQGPVKFGGGLRFGEFVFGQIKEVQ